MPHPGSRHGLPRARSPPGPGQVGGESLPQTRGSPLSLLQPHLQWSLCFVHFTYSLFTPHLLESHTNVCQPAVPPTREHMVLVQDRGAKFCKGAERKAGIERTILRGLHLNNQRIPQTVLKVTQRLKDFTLITFSVLPSYLNSSSEWYLFNNCGSKFYLIY